MNLDEMLIERKVFQGEIYEIFLNFFLLLNFLSQWLIDWVENFVVVKKKNFDYFKEFFEETKFFKKIDLLHNR